MAQFRIEEKISESGSTTVYRAYQETLDRAVLLKVLHQHLANDPAVRERFTREAKACAHLRSEHIVQVYDLTEYNGCPAIVMEYVHGRSLKDILAATPPDREKLARTTAISILKALSLAHHRGIVHRDIKPGNILIADDGVIKLTDFGLAHIAHSTTVTIEGTVLGTPAYMAPEQIRGEGADERADFFSLGVTLVEILTGERIFEGSTYSECVKKITEFRTDHLDRLTKTVAAHRLNLVKRLMEPDPKNRYQSAADALRDLGEREDTVKDKTTKSVTRRVSVAAALFIGFLVIAGSWYFGKHLSSPASQAPVGVLQKSWSRDSVQHPEDHGAAGNLKEEGKNSGRIARQDGHMTTDKTAASAVASVRDSSKIVFTSYPWAKIYVDGRLVGETPLAQPILLARGKHSVTFSNPSFDPIMKTINVLPGRDETVSANFLENAGFLECSVQPWADVYVDEQYKDTTPLNRPIILSAGRHRVRFHNGAFNDAVRDITIKPHDTLTITIKLMSLR